MGGQQKTAIILVNLGTPTAPTAKAVGRFLREFLGDPRVVEAPRIPWWFVLNGIIVPIRSRRVAKSYQSIWTHQGSPLRVITEQQTAALQQTLNNELSTRAPRVTFAMTYGEPALKTQVAELTAEGIEKIIILPLYPQYSGSTTGAIYDQVADIIRLSRNVPDMLVVKQYFDHPAYIQALEQTVREHWQKEGRAQRLLMSFHGIPQEYADKGDPYPEQCIVTAKALAQALGLQSDAWAYSFQSRFGPKKWLQPYTDETLCRWAETGVDSVAVISPAFSADCLETLEELNIENRALFLSKGGKIYSVVSCLNDYPQHISMMKTLVLSSTDF